MIQVTDMSGADLYLNGDLIEKVEAVPDTILVLVNGRRYMVRESADVVVRRMQDFRTDCRSRRDDQNVRRKLKRSGVAVYRG